MVVGVALDRQALADVTFLVEDETAIGRQGHEQFLGSVKAGDQRQNTDNAQDAENGDEPIHGVHLVGLRRATVI